MSTIAILGGHGKVSLRLIPLLVERGHQPVAMIRHHSQSADVESLGAAWRLLDIENSSPRDFIETLRGVDTIVFAAGAGADGNAHRKTTVDLEGSLRATQAAESLGIRRFVQVSAMGIDHDPDPARGAVWEAYVTAKRDADALLRLSSLRWTIIRPGTLTDDDGTGLVRLGIGLPPGSIPRADVAAVLAAAIDDDRTIGRQWDVVSGSDPIPAALEAAL